MGQQALSYVSSLQMQAEGLVVLGHTVHIARKTGLAKPHNGFLSVSSDTVHATCVHTPLVKQVNGQVQCQGNWVVYLYQREALQSHRQQAETSHRQKETKRVGTKWYL